MQLIWVLLILCSSGVFANRIIGGIEAVEGEIPWQVSIQTTGGIPLCGASIIAPEYILTARNCDTFLGLEKLRIVVGNFKYFTPGSIHGVTEVTNHPDGNIGVWKITPPFLYDDNTKAVYLPDQGTHTSPGTNLTFSGWGSTVGNPGYSEFLMIAEGPVISKSDCNATLLGSLRPDEVCVGFSQGGIGFCAGDNGGPLMRNRVQRGIASWAVDCGAEGVTPPIFVEVSAYRNWIAQVAGV